MFDVIANLYNSIQLNERKQGAQLGLTPMMATSPVALNNVCDRCKDGSKLLRIQFPQQETSSITNFFSATAL